MMPSRRHLIGPTALVAQRLGGEWRTDVSKRDDPGRYRAPLRGAEPRPATLVSPDTIAALEPAQ